MPLRCGRQNGSGEVGLCPRLRLRRRPHKRRKVHVAVHKPLVAALTHSDGRRHAHRRDRHCRQMARPALVHVNVRVVGGRLTHVVTCWNLSDAANIANECRGSRRDKSDQRGGGNGAAEPLLHTQTRDAPVEGFAVAGTRLGSHLRGVVDGLAGNRRSRPARWAGNRGPIGSPPEAPPAATTAASTSTGSDWAPRSSDQFNAAVSTPDDCVLDEVLLEKMTGPSCQRQRTVGT